MYIMYLHDYMFGFPGQTQWVCQINLPFLLVHLVCSPPALCLPALDIAWGPDRGSAPPILWLQQSKAGQVQYQGLYRYHESSACWMWLESRARQGPQERQATLVHLGSAHAWLFGEGSEKSKTVSPLKLANFSWPSGQNWARRRRWWMLRPSFLLAGRAWNRFGHPTRLKNMASLRQSR